MTRRELAADACTVIGYVAVVAGLALVSLALALIIGGIVLAVCGALASIAASREQSVSATAGEVIPIRRTRRRLSRRQRREQAKVNSGNPFESHAP